MIRHCVLLRVVEGTDPEDIDALVENLRLLPAQIDEIEHFSVGRDLGLSPENVEIAVVADFIDESHYLAYSVHPAHQAVIERHVKPILAERHATQFTC